VNEVSQHRSWCTLHLDDTDPVSNDRYVACETIVSAAVRPRGFGVYCVVSQEPQQAAPQVVFESDSTALTVAEALEFATAVATLLDRIGADR
jgi:hypothetical protein